MIRKAKLRDVQEIQQLIKNYSTRGEMLPRSLSELYDNIRDFISLSGIAEWWESARSMSAGRISPKSAPLPSRKRSGERGWRKISEGLS